MAFRTYKIPIGAASLPFSRVGPPAYEPPAKAVVQGTNFDYTELTFLHDGDGTFVRNQGIFLRFPVPHSYTSLGIRKVRLRWKTTVLTGNARWTVTHEPYGDTDTWDAAFSGGPDSVDTAAQGVAGDLSETVITLSGTTWTAGEEAILYVEREADHANDTLDAAIVPVSVDVILEEPDFFEIQQTLPTPIGGSIFWQGYTRKARVLKECWVYAYKKNSIGMLDFDVENTDTGNTMLNALFDMNSIVDDTWTQVTLSSTAADLIVPAGGRFKPEFIASGPADALDLYFLLVFDDPE